MPYVYSTLTNDQVYTNYSTEHTKDLNLPVGRVLIKGGSNRNNKVLHTPHGVATEVTEKQLEMLENNADFKLHMKNGFIKVDKAEVHPDKAISDMDKRDRSSPIVPEDYKGEKPFYDQTNSGAKPVTGEKAKGAK